MKLPEYEQALDWQHCESMREASNKLSEITRILNTVIMITKRSEMELILKIADLGDEIDDKGSRDNKLIKLLTLDRTPETRELFVTYKEGKSATSQIRNKKDAIFEELMAWKKIEGYRPN